MQECLTRPLRHQGTAVGYVRPGHLRQCSRFGDARPAGDAEEQAANIDAQVPDVEWLARRGRIGRPDVPAALLAEPLGPQSVLLRSTRLLAGLRARFGLCRRHNGPRTMDRSYQTFSLPNGKLLTAFSSPNFRPAADAICLHGRQQLYRLLGFHSIINFRPAWHSISCNQRLCVVSLLVCLSFSYGLTTFFFFFFSLCNIESDVPPDFEIHFRHVDGSDPVDLFALHGIRTFLRPHPSRMEEMFEVKLGNRSIELGRDRKIDEEENVIFLLGRRQGKRHGDGIMRKVNKLIGSRDCLIRPANGFHRREISVWIHY